jgi:hypothetical protein
MSSPNSLLGQARSFARDFPRDQMPRQYLWDVVDYVPLVIDANLTGRGGWTWGSTVLGGDATSGILAPFPTGERLLVTGADGQWYEINQNSPYTATAVGACRPGKQNPIAAGSAAAGGTAIVAFDATRAQVPQILSSPSTTLTFADMHASAPKAPVGTYYNDMIVVGGAPGAENIISFSYPGALQNAWDSISQLGAPKPVTALAALRAVIIVFHAGSTSRIRGSVPDRSTGHGDMGLEPLFDRVGTTDPRTISYWQDSVIFADEHGVHVTDGAIIRNLCSQGGILYYWRQLYANQISLAACTFLDYYQITVRRSDGTNVTLVCDLNRRQWFRLSNIYAISYVASSGSTGMERIWASMAGTKRLARIGPVYFPITAGTLTANVDADGTPILPSLETGWYALGREGRKRARFAYLSYDARLTPITDKSLGGGLADPLEGEQLEAPVVDATSPIFAFDFVTDPYNEAYTAMGGLPPTTRRSRYRLPVNRATYGLAFRVRQLQPSTITRIYDLAVDSETMEASRH